MLACLLAYSLAPALAPPHPQALLGPPGGAGGGAHPAGPPLRAPSPPAPTPGAPAGSGPCVSIPVWATLALRPPPTPAPEVDRGIPNRTLIQKRIGIMKTVAWFMILWLVLAYGWVQLWKGREMQRLALAQAVKTRTTPAPRGIIFDRNGNKLVDNRRALHLVIQYRGPAPGPAARSRPWPRPCRPTRTSSSAGWRPSAWPRATACWCSRTTWTTPPWPGPRCCGPGSPS